MALEGKGGGERGKTGGKAEREKERRRCGSCWWSCCCFLRKHIGIPSLHHPSLPEAKLTNKSDVFGITDGPPLHDPLAVAAVIASLSDDNPEAIPFFDGPRERYEVTVVTEGTYKEALAGARTGQITARLLPLGEEGVRIPRGVDIARFWEVLERCVERADKTNAATVGSTGVMGG